MKEYKKEYYQNNKEKILKRTNQYYENNKDIINEKAKEYRLDHKEKRKEYYENNKEELNKKSGEWSKNNRDRVNERARNYILSDNYKTAKLISRRILVAVKSGGAKKCNSSSKLLGCSIDFYRGYIESKFTKGMTFENHGNNGWHFDHIKPCKSFDMQDPAQQYLCFHYTNIQPLWATTSIAMSYGESSDYIGNLEKQDKIDRGD